MFVIPDKPNSFLNNSWGSIRIAELNATTVVSVKIDEASVKIRTGPPNDEEEDYYLQVWAGIIPLLYEFGVREDDPDLSSGIKLPVYIKNILK